jgi:hypothetical protein
LLKEEAIMMSFAGEISDKVEIDFENSCLSMHWAEQGRAGQSRAEQGIVR